MRYEDAFGSRPHREGRLLKQGDPASQAKFLRSCSELLRAGVKFATRNMSEEEHRALVKRLCNLRCDLTQSGMADMHTLEKTTYRPQEDSTKGLSVVSILETLSALGALMCMAMSMANLTRPKFFNEDSRNKTGQLPRPQGPETFPWT